MHSHESHDHRGNGSGRPRPAPESSSTTWERRQDWSLALALFVLALVPRVLNLAAFLTIDEPAWVSRSARFAQALLRGDLAATFQTNHPGVVTMWTGSLGLWLYHWRHPAAGLSDFLAWAANSNNTPPADLLPFVRFPTGVLAALSVAAVYLLARRTFGRPIALLGAVFVALDPFFIAHSRVLHHDALGTLFVAVSLTSLVAYLTTDRRERFAALSGAAAGLAALSKTSSLFLGPFACAAFGLAVVAAWVMPAPGPEHRRRALVGAVRGGLVWIAAMGAAFFAAWPAMWVDPLGVPRRLLAGTASLVEAGHNQFFYGQVVTDPGPWFYPAIAAFRTTPFTAIGLAFAVIFSAVGFAGIIRSGLFARGVSSFAHCHPEGASFATEGSRARETMSPVVRLATSFFARETPRSQTTLPQGDSAQRKRRPARRDMPGRERSQFGALALYVFFVACFAAFITLSPKKQDRYLLPAFPILDLAAGVGWFGLLRLALLALRKYVRAPARVAANGTLLVAGLAGSLWIAAGQHPYYLSYYNALAGGTARAQQDLLIGWGEGMDMVGRYLNQKDTPESLTVAAVPNRTLIPYFRGTVTSYLTTTAPALAADYIVEYVDSVQRQGPDVALWQFLQDQKPEAVFRLHGLDYAWLYPGPRALTSTTPAFDVPVDGDFGGRLRLLGYSADATSRPGSLRLSLFWQARTPMAEDYAVSVRLLDAFGHRWAQQDGGLVGGQLPTRDFPMDRIARDERTLPLPPGAPAGDYRLQVLVYSTATKQDLAPALGRIVGPVSVTKQPAVAGELAPRTRLDLAAGDGLRLLGIDLPPGAVRPGADLSPVLFWAATRPVSWTVGLSLSGADGRAIGEAARLWSLAGGDALKDWAALSVPRDAASGTYTLTATVGSTRLPLGDVRIEGRAREFVVPRAIPHPGHASFDGKIAWLGYDLALPVGGPLRLTLYWQATAPMTDSYKTFVHVLGADGRIVGQRDVIPGGGLAPTQDWLPGEVVSDTLEIPLAADAPPADRVAFGWYDEATGRRLPVLDAAGPANADHLDLKVSP